jgi:release factor glutamine methyltransferase
MTGAEALRRATRALAENGVADAARDARLLLAHSTNRLPDRIGLHLNEALTDNQSHAYDEAIRARMARQPVSQIVGHRLFWGRSFCVTRDVLDPRPETETLVALALEEPFERVLDLGTGSGAILLTLLAERPSATGVGVDVSAEALAVARLSADALGVSPRCVLQQSDWFTSVEGLFDLIVSNPPYIPANEMWTLAREVRDWEPHLALTPGGDGLDAYRRIIGEVLRYLEPGGRLMVEIGPTQAEPVCALCSEVGLCEIEVRRDLDGRERVVAARRTMPRR